MRILLIHQAFASPATAGGTRHYELARLAGEQGHHFTVVASRVSYLTGEDQAGIDQAQVKGLQVLTAPALSSIHRSFVWRVFSFLYFMVSSFWKAFRSGPIDLVMGTSPPIFQAVAAWLVARLRNRAFVLEIRDLWPDFAVDMGVLTNPLLIALSKRLERFLRARASHIVVNSPAYRDILIRRGEAPHRITLIANGVDLAMFDPADDGAQMRAELGLEDKFVVAYTGAMGPANDIATVVEAARLLADDERIHLLMVGAGKDQAAQEARATELGLTNISFIGARPKNEMPAILAASDACLAILQNVPMFKTTYPNKVFDYLAAGRPVILAIDGVIREVVEQAQAGRFTPPGDAPALAQTIGELSRDPEQAKRMGQAGRTYVAEHFDRTDQAAQFVALAQEIVDRGQGYQGPKTIRRAIKRLIDICASALGLILGAPFMLVLALVVRWGLGSPVIFKQERPGKNNRLFKMYKFRTMTNARSADGELLPDQERLTKLGRFLRATSLDELPELFNVLAGHMSLVGPRPLLTEYLPLYSPTQARRHEVRPGITGLAQVRGRNILSWQDKFQADVWYVDNWSLWLDVKIIAMTFWKIFKREGINQPGQATTEKFKG